MASSRATGCPRGPQLYILHEGVIGATDGELTEIKYKKVMELPADPAEGGSAVQTIDVANNGWIGFTDHYWMTTLIPPPGQPFTAVAKYSPTTDTFQTDVRMPVVTVEPGQTATSTTSLFAGAKEWSTIRDYQRTCTSTGSSTRSTGAGSSS